MAEVVLFHHALGLSPGITAFADELRSEGHTVHAPDLFEGRTFDSIESGMAFVEGIGFGEVIQRGAAAARELPAEVVYLGFSLGVLPAQMLAQTRPGARGAILVHSCVAPSEFGGPWPNGLPVQIHMMGADPEALPPNEDLEAARHLDEAVESAELFLYPGDRRLFADRSLPDYDAAAATLFGQRV